MGGVLATLRRRRGEKVVLTSVELWVVVGHEFCVTRSQISQEAWVADFACALCPKPDLLGLFVEGWPNGQVLIRALSYDEFPTPT